VTCEGGGLRQWVCIFFVTFDVFYVFSLLCFFMRVNEGRVLSKCSSEYYIIGIRTAQRCIETVKFFFVKGQCYKMAIFI
jgi:hypothetical protein